MTLKLSWVDLVGFPLSIIAVNICFTKILLKQDVVESIIFFIIFSFALWFCWANIVRNVRWVDGK